MGNELPCWNDTERGAGGIGGGQHQFKWGINQVLHHIILADGEGGVEVGRKKYDGEGDVKEKGQGKVVGKWEGENPSFPSTFTSNSPSPPLGCDREVSRGRGRGEGGGGGGEREKVGGDGEWEGMGEGPSIFNDIFSNFVTMSLYTDRGRGRWKPRGTGVGGHNKSIWGEVWFSPSHFAPSPSVYLSFPSLSPSSPFSPFPIRPPPHLSFSLPMPPSHNKGGGVGEDLFSPSQSTSPTTFPFLSPLPSISPFSPLPSLSPLPHTPPPLPYHPPPLRGRGGGGLRVGGG